MLNYNLKDNKYFNKQFAESSSLRQGANGADCEISRCVRGRHLKDFIKLHHQLSTASPEDVRKMIAVAGMPADVQIKAETALEELEALSSVLSGTPEHARALTYAGYLASLPWSRTSENKPDLRAVEKVLSESLSERQSARDEIVKNLTFKVLNNGKKTKILLVDDERIALDSLGLILTREGYTVVPARNGSEAIDKLKETSFDVVITDLIMGDVDGTAVVKEARNICPDTRVIMITGYATVDTAVQALRMGAFHYIEKPVRVAELLKAIRDSLGQNDAHRNKHVLCFEGPSVPEKISLGKKIAGALGRQYVHILLSELREVSDVAGQSRTDEGAKPGRIIDAIRSAGTADPVIMLEGHDREDYEFKGDVLSALLEVLDPDRNQDFTDRYLAVPFNLSPVIFIITAGNADSIQGPLRDLLDIITL